MGALAMEAALAMPVMGLPRACYATTWNKGLLVGLVDGSVAVFENEELVCVFRLDDDEIVFLTASAELVYVGYKSGCFAKYMLLSGLLSASTVLECPVQGALICEETVVVWDTAGVQVHILDKWTLDVIQVITLEAPPLRLCLSHGIVLALSSGTLQWRTDKLQFTDELDIDSLGGGSKDQGPLLDAVAISNSKWVILWRHRWAMYIITDKYLELEFSAAAPSPFRLCVASDLTASIALLCDDGQVVIVEQNNIQVVAPTWSLALLASLSYDRDVLTALLTDFSMFVLRRRQSVWEWEAKPTLSTVLSTEWIVCGERAATANFLGNLDTSDGSPVFQTLYTASASISSMLVIGSKVYLGLTDGSLELLENLKVRERTYLFATPVTEIRMLGEFIVAVSHDSVAVLTPEPLIIPVGAPVTSVALDKNVLSLKVADGGVLQWGLEERTRLSECDTVTFQASSERVIATTCPFVPAAVNDAVIDEEKPVAFIARACAKTFVTYPAPQSRSAIPLLCTLRAAGKEGDLSGIIQILRNQSSVPSYEEFVICCGVRDPVLLKAARRILKGLWKQDHLEDLLKLGGRRALILIGVVFPLVDEKNWLVEHLQSMLEGSITDKLVALDVLCIHPDLLEIPFHVLEELENAPSAVRRFIAGISHTEKARIVSATSKEIQKAPSKAAVCAQVLGIALESKYIVPENTEFLTAIDVLFEILSRRLPGGARAKAVLVKVRKMYESRIIFNRQRQRLLVVALINNGFAKEFDFSSGHSVTLAGPQGAVTNLEFIDDGKSVRGKIGKKLYLWTFKTGIASLFGSSDRIEPTAV